MISIDGVSSISLITNTCINKKQFMIGEYACSMTCLKKKTCEMHAVLLISDEHPPQTAYVFTHYHVVKK